MEDPDAPDDLLLGLDSDSGEESDHTLVAPAPPPKTYYAQRKLRQETARKNQEFAAFAGTFFEEVDYETDAEANKPTFTVAELCTRLGTEYPKCPDIDARIDQIREALISTWIRKGHAKSIQERMKKDLLDKTWTCPTCHKTMRVTECYCGEFIDKHFGNAPIACLEFKPVLNAEHGSLVCVRCMRSTPGWETIQERKSLLHSIPGWLVYLRHLLVAVHRKSAIHCNLLRWKDDFFKYKTMYAPATQTILEFDSTAIYSNDVFFPTRAENQSRMYQRYRFDGVFNEGTWSDLWVPALTLLEKDQDWKDTYFGMCRLSGQLGLALALWVKAANEFVPDPGRRQCLKPGETIAPTDPWTANYFRYTVPYDQWMPALDRVICFWLPLTVRGPGKCLPALTIGVNELHYNRVKAYVTEMQRQARSQSSTSSGSSRASPPSRRYQQKRSKRDRGRDYATGEGVRADTSNVEDFTVLCTAVSQMITSVQQVPIEGVGATGAYQFVNHVLSSCNEHRSRYSSKYRKPGPSTPVPQINACYSDFISFVRILKLFGVALNPSVYPSKEAMSQGRHVWNLPSSVAATVDIIPTLPSKLESAMRYIYTGLPVCRVEQIRDLLTDEMRTILTRLGTTPDAESSEGSTCGRAWQYYSKLTLQLNAHAAKLGTRRDALRQDHARQQALALSHTTAIIQTERYYRRQLAHLAARHEGTMHYMQTYATEMDAEIQSNLDVQALVEGQLQSIETCNQTLFELFKADAPVAQLQQVASKYCLAGTHTLDELCKSTQETVQISRRQLDDFNVLADSLKRHVV